MLGRKLAQPRRIALIGNSLPRRCGIATFTTDLQQAIGAAYPDVETCIVALTDGEQCYDYPSSVRFEISDNNPDDYAKAAEFLNAGQFDAVSLQHEFGIFGGTAGDHVLALLGRLTVPVTTTLHTVLAAPAPPQRHVMASMIAASSKVIVMAEKGRELLQSVYQAPAHKIDVIPHGIPDVPFVGSEVAKVAFGFGGRPLILTFGLLSPNKGIEFMIDAMPLILKQRPDAVYVVLGATHPNLVRYHGEAYRESLMARVRELGVEDHVVFLNRFVDQATLLRYISMCDVYVTPYLNEAQMTSGTLAYSFGSGKAVVSTPYWHARELLADGCGILVPFRDAQRLGTEIGNLLTDDTRRLDMGERAYAVSRPMTWAQTARRYMAAMDPPQPEKRLKVIVKPPSPRSAGTVAAVPDMQTGHLLAMCDDTGLIQHAVHAVPDRSHGYCVDDNARALLLACVLSTTGESRLPEILSARLAAFVQHAWNPDSGRFRNFMGFDRSWLEASGSEDSHGRTLWALGVCAGRDAIASRRLWARSLFAEALPVVASFSSPRAWAFTLLGLDAYCRACAEDSVAEGIRRELADRLLALLAAVETRDWVWFEESLAYDNARLSEALIVTGMATHSSGDIAAGLRTLRWLMSRQTTPAGLFRPIGSDSFGRKWTTLAFDQQPLEATATIAACLAAWRADDGADWKADANRAFAWFLGANDLSLPLVDVDTGSCRDGLHPDRANENRGGESVVSYLLALAEMRQMTRLTEGRTRLRQVIS